MNNILRNAIKIGLPLEGLAEVTSIVEANNITHHQIKDKVYRADWSYPARPEHISQLEKLIELYTDPLFIYRMLPLQKYTLEQKVDFLIRVVVELIKRNPELIEVI